MEIQNRLKILLSHLSAEKILELEAVPGGDLWKEICNSDEKQLPDFASSWYLYNIALINAWKLDRDNKITNKVVEFYTEGDMQIPPDLIKMQRLYTSLRIINPTHILELGCGTSSLTINTYIENCKNKKNVLTIDNDKNWLEGTKNKIVRITESLNESHEFYFCQNSEETIQRTGQFLADSDRLFIYVDAKVIEEDKYQGMEFVMKIYDKLPASTTILIDARLQAVKALQYLANKAKCRINVIVPMQIYSKRENLSEEEQNDLMRKAFAVQQFNIMSKQTIALIQKT